MKKLTKKRLKEIKEHLDFIQFEYDRQGYISTNTADELIEYSKYLIEKVEYWRDQHRKRVDELEEAYFKIQLLENKLERYKEIINLFKTAFENGDAEHRTSNGRSVQAMALIEEMEGGEE